MILNLILKIFRGTISTETPTMTTMATKRRTNIPAVATVDHMTVHMAAAPMAKGSNFYFLYIKVY